MRNLTPDQIREILFLKMEKSFKKYVDELIDGIDDKTIEKYCKNDDWAIDFDIDIKIKFGDKIITRKWN